MSVATDTCMLGKLLERASKRCTRASSTLSRLFRRLKMSAAGDVPLFEGFGGVQLAQMAVAS
ncbi:MAG TPA: hypothetical protein VNJ06_09565 [Gemmatimonadales bacterium]|nr:hypothetical protein [Gemmatimonadales bacterium]